MYGELCRQRCGTPGGLARRATPARLSPADVPPQLAGDGSSAAGLSRIWGGGFSGPPPLPLGVGASDGVSAGTVSPGAAQARDPTARDTDRRAL